MVTAGYVSTHLAHKNDRVMHELLAIWGHAYFLIDWTGPVGNLS